MKRALLVLLAAIILALLLAACTAEPVGDAAKGKEIFNTGGTSQIACATCHSLDGSELVGPSLQGIGERAGTRMDGVSAEDYIRESILQPSMYVVPGYSDAMFKDYLHRLSPDDIDNVVAFLLTQ